MISHLRGLVKQLSVKCGWFLPIRIVGVVGCESNERFLSADFSVLDIRQHGSGSALYFLSCFFGDPGLVISSRRLVGKRPGPGVDLSGLEVIEDLVDRLIYCDDGEDLHLGATCGACERDVKDAS